MKTTIALIVSLIFSIGAFAQESPVFSNKDLGKAYENYIEIKEALVNSNSQEASGLAQELKKSLTSLEGSDAAQSAASSIHATEDLSSQRKAFASLSVEMGKLINAEGLVEGKVYRAFCPMANNSEGAYWLSNEKQIRNPYMGDKMMSCGMVKQTIE